jgi:hypothetical protein
MNPGTHRPAADGVEQPFFSPWSLPGDRRQLYGSWWIACAGPPGHFDGADRFAAPLGNTALHTFRSGCLATQSPYLKIVEGTTRSARTNGLHLARTCTKVQTENRSSGRCVGPFPAAP